MKSITPRIQKAPCRLLSPGASKWLLGLAGYLTLTATPAFAFVISNGDVATGSHVGNLISNGSFETGNPGSNLGWTPGSHVGGYPGSEVAAIPGWSSSYPAGAYGWWGPLGFAGAPAPDGLNQVYFGNSFNTAGASASYAASGEITFASAPVFGGRPGPVTLAQTVGGLSTTDTYRLDFWVSGESNTSGFVGDGLFGLEITGYGTTYLRLPTSSNPFGASQRYYVDFTPTSASTTIKFLNWGHITDLGGTGTELVLDDVILNRRGGGGAVPDAGSSLAFLGTALASLVGLRNCVRRK